MTLFNATTAVTVDITASLSLERTVEEKERQSGSVLQDTAEVNRERTQWVDMMRRSTLLRRPKRSDGANAPLDSLLPVSVSLIKGCEG